MQNCRLASYIQCKYFLTACQLLAQKDCKSKRIKKAKHRIPETTPSGNIVLRRKRPLRNSNAITANGMQVGYVKICFWTDRGVSGSEALTARICVHPPRWCASMHDGALAIRGVINNVGGGRTLAKLT